MKKALVGLVGLIAVAVIGFVGAVSMQPAHTHLERSVVVQAQPADAFPLMADYRQFVTWSPWTGLDPNQTTEFSEPSMGAESWYSWDGNDDVGAGKMVTTEFVENQKVAQDLIFLRPFEATAQVSFLVAAEGEGSKLTWTYDADNDFMGKMALLFVDMEEALGGDFQKGLDTLAPMVEEAAAERVAAEKQAEEERLKAEAEAAAEGEDADGGTEG